MSGSPDLIIFGLSGLIAGVSQLATRKKYVLVAVPVVLVYLLLMEKSSTHTDTRKHVSHVMMDVNVSAQTYGAASKTKAKVTSEQEFEDRRLRVERVCAENPVTSPVNGKIYTDNQTGLLYCIVPKTGCTFWKLFFQSIKKNRTSVNNMKTLWDTSSKNEVHGSGQTEVYELPKHSPSNLDVRFMVTRDPFSRLISTYLDKAYLPDFWRSHMTNLLYYAKLPDRDDKDFLRQNFDEMAEKIEPGFKRGVNTTYNYRPCGKYITFHEYVSGIIPVNEEHERPLHSLCNPCSMNITHISRMDTFTADARGILAKANMDHVLDDWDTSNQREEEVQIILDFNFQIARGRLNENSDKECASPEEIAYRLWYNFIWKGFIHPGWNYKFINDPSATRLDVKAHLKKQLMEAMEAGMKEPHLMKEAKKNFRKQCYRSLSDKTFGELMRRHSLDVRLFGFEKQRDEVYKWVYDE